MNDRQGAYKGICDADYHADCTTLSSSGARLLLPPSCPAKFQAHMLNPPEHKDHFDFGKITHKLVLGDGAPITVLDPAIDGLKKDGTIADNPTATAGWKQAVSEARERGDTPVHINDYQKARKMADAVKSHPTAGPLFTDGEAETSLYSTDPVTGVRLRARPDWMAAADGRLLMVDLKTAITAEQSQFERSAARYGYHIQDAFYRHVAQLLGLHEDPRFVFVAVEKTEPHLVNVIEWDTEAAAEGDRLVRQAIDTYARCRDTNTWPGYPLGIQPISLPIWAIDDEIEFS